MVVYIKHYLDDFYAQMYKFYYFPRCFVLIYVWIVQ